MQIVQRLVAVFLIAIGLVVAFHFVFEPFYRDLTDTGQVWRILDWITAPAVLIVVAARWHEKRQLDLLGPNGGSNYQRGAASVAFYIAIFLTLWFFWNWFDSLMAGGDPQDLLRMINWSLVDPLFAVMSCTTGVSICRSARG